jgi:hypothetical protein
MVTDQAKRQTAVGSSRLLTRDKPTGRGLVTGRGRAGARAHAKYLSDFGACKKIPRLEMDAEGGQPPAGATPKAAGWGDWGKIPAGPCRLDVPGDTVPA